jgi:RNA polymerase sigma-70 factor (ECF subfamily)
MDAPRHDDERWREHAEAARRLARHLVAGDAVDDVAQEALRVSLVRPGDAGRPARPWLHGIVRNVARTFRRREGMRRSVEARAARTRGGATSDPAALLLRAQEHRRAIDALLRLEEPYRATLILRFLDDVEPSEIAALQRVPLETVRTRLRRGLERIRADLDARHGGDRRRWTLLLAPTTGALAVKKIAAAAALLVLLGGGAAVLVATHGRSAPEAGPASVLAADAPEPPSPRLVGTGPAPLAADALPAPVALDDPGAIDRERDVHGVAVREDGTPVAGAEVSVRARPWTHAAPLGTSAFEERTLAATRSAADGTFRLTLARGAAATLCVHATGLAAFRAEQVGAGERLRVVLGPAVRFVVRTVDAKGAPLPGVDVRLYRATGLMTWGFVREGYVREGTTDADGRLVFDDLAGGSRGTWALLHAWGGGATVFDRVEIPDEGERVHEVVLSTPRTVRGRVTDAATGAPVRGAVVGVGWEQRPRVVATDDGRYEIPMSAAQNLSLYVSADGYAWRGLDAKEDVLDFALERGVTVRGRLVGPGGVPVGGAAVAAWGRTENALVGRTATRAADDGRFALADLSPTAPVEVWVEAGGFGRRGLAVDPPGAQRDLGDVVLAPARRVEGRVLDHTGAPVAGVGVHLSGGSVERSRFWTGQGRAPAGLREERVSDDLGRFRFAEMAPGDYRLVAERGGEKIDQALALRDADVVDLEVRLRSGRRLVVNVRGPDGERMPFVTVQADLPDGSTRRAEDPTGASRVEVVVPREGETRVTAAGSAGTSSPPAVVVPTDATEVTIALLPADDWKVEGTVLSPEGRPLASAVVGTVVDGRIQQVAETDAEGRFAPTLRGGQNARVAVTGEVVDPRTRRFVEGGFEADPIDVRRGGGDVVLRARSLPMGRTLRVVVEDPRGTPLPAIPVHLQRPNGGAFQPAGTQGSDGSFEFQGLVARPFQVVRGSGAYRMEPGWVDPYLEVVPAGQTVVYRFVAGTVVRGEVLAPDGTRVPRTTVFVNGDDPTRMRYAPVDGEGRFAVALDPDRHLPATQTVSQGGGSAPRLEGRVVVEALPAEPVTIRLAPAVPR